MGNEQKMRDAFEKWGTANTPERERLAFYDGWHAREALAGEQVELTDAELDEIWTKHAMSATFDCVHLLRDAIAAHEAKRASCSQNAKKSTCEAGRVDETGKSEHVGGAA